MAILRADHIQKAFGTHVVIDRFSYAFDAGKIYAIVGASGCGKTTLLNILGLLEEKDSGDIWYQDLKNPTLKGKKATQLLRNYISYLFQNYALIEEESVYQNCLLALRYVKTKQKRKMILEVLRKLHLEELIDKKVYELSGGEQQRVALARAILKPSRVLLCDEPTGNLDEANRDKVFHVLQTIKEMNRCVIIVTHDKTLASMCDEIIELG